MAVDGDGKVRVVGVNRHGLPPHVTTYQAAEVEHMFRFCVDFSGRWCFRNAAQRHAGAIRMPGGSSSGGASEWGWSGCTEIQTYN